jgi:hypothetical protein
MEQESAETRKELEQLQAERRTLVAAGQRTDAVDAKIRNAQTQLALQDRLFRQALSLADAEDKREAEGAARNGAASKSATLGTAPPTGAATQNFEAIGLRTNWRSLDAAIQKANENPSLLLYKIQTNAYKYSWALIPISMPFVWLMFLHRRRYRQYRAYDHVVFVTYSIAFMSLGFIALTLLRPLGIGEWLAGMAITFVPPIHMYRQLRGAYRLSRWSAVWRTFALIVFASIAASLFLLLLLALGALA